MARKTAGGGARKNRNTFTLRSPECLERRELLAVFTVDTFSDTAAKNLATGQDILGKVSLRGAVMAANRLGGAHTINLTAGTYTLSLIGPGDDLAETGDLDIKSNITLNGVDASSTIVDGSSNDRVFQILGARTVQLNKMTITNGSASTGGGIWNQGTLTITDTILSKNVASGADGLTSPFFGFAGGNGASAYGGGIYNSPLGTVTLNGTTVTDNIARGGNGGLGSDGRSGNGEFPGPSAGGAGGNGGAGLGGGIYNSGGVVSILANSFFSLNEARGGNGGDGGKGGSGFPFDQGITAGAVGGKGGTGGPGAGGGVYHVGNGKLLDIQSSTFELQKVNGGNGGNGGGGGSGGPGNDKFSPAPGGSAGNGGTGGNATGGAVHNGGGDVSFQQTTLRQATVHGGMGGVGGIGGFGGGVSASSIEVGTYNGNSGGNGGRGGNGGQSLGGGIHSTGGTVTLDQQSNALLNIVSGTFGGAGGAGGYGSPGGERPNAEVKNGLGGNGGDAGISAGGSLAAGGGISATGGTVNVSTGSISQNIVTGGRGANGTTGGVGGDGAPIVRTISVDPLILIVTGGAYGGSTPGGAGGAGKGGGIYIDGATLNAQSVMFFGNQAVGGGGGFGAKGSNYGGDASTGSGGDALPGTAGGVGGSGQGGGMCVGRGFATVTTSTFNSGFATGSVGGAGGNGGSGLTAKSGTNGVGGDAAVGGPGGAGGMGVGGGVAATTTNGTISVNQSTFSNNEAAGRSGANGGVAGVVGQGVTFGANSKGGAGGKGGDGRGGAFFASHGDMGLTNNTLDGNKAAGDNGGLGGAGQIPNANGPDAVAGMGRGGAGFHGGLGSASLVNNTITRNKISNFYGSDLGSGGGLVNESGTLIMLNNLVALNFYDNTILGAGKQAKGTFNSQGNNLISNTDGSAGFIASDRKGTGLAILNAKVDTLTSNGGTTQTCKLLSGSIAINAGAALGAPATDQRGSARHGAVDIGSFEV